MHFQSEAVPGAVPERLAQPRLLQHAACGAIDGRGVDPRPDGVDGGLLGGQDGGVNTANVLDLAAQPTPSG